MLMKNKMGKKAFITDVSYIKSPKGKSSKKRIEAKESKNIKPFRNLRSQEINKGVGRTRLPKISGSSKQKKMEQKKKKNITKELQTFVGSFNREFKMKRNEMHNPKSVYTNNNFFNKNTKIECVENFLSRQEKKARKNMKSVYQRLAKNSEKDVFELLNKMENKSSFQQLLKMKEEELIITKKKFNQLSFQLKKAKENLHGLNRQVKKEKLDLVDRTNEVHIDNAIQNERQLNDDIEEIRLVTESLVHRKKMYSADILTLKKNTEALKTLLRRWKKIRSDLNRKKNTNIKLSNHLLEKIISEKKKRDEVSEVFGNSNNLKNLFHDELELFRDKIMLEEMIKKKDNDGNPNTSYNPKTSKNSKDKSS
jgi:N-terminal acetyltransferase B complex non-catalytic subunit